MVAKSTSNARILYGIYVGLTIILVILLKAGGLNLYDSILHAFTTAGTGGLSDYTASVMAFQSPYIDGVITVFMIIFGMNFTMFYLLFLKEWRVVWKNEELRGYIVIVLGAIGVLTANLYHYYGSIGKAFRYAAFQVASATTTTGYFTANYSEWPMLSKAMLLGLMFIGACASSTGGGIKISRFIITLKHMKREVKKVLHPKSVNIIKMNGRKLSDDILRGVQGYLMCYFLIFITSVLIVSLDNFDLETTFTAVLGSLSNIGPGLGRIVGPDGSYAAFSNVSKLVLTFDMLAGRLEIFPMLVLFTVPFQRKKF
jgi:trk system potassium uptake protein TrkH